MSSRSIFPVVPSDHMTLSARFYLGLTSVYAMSLASVCWIVPERLNSVSFQSVRDNVPMGFVTWAVVHLAIAVLAAYAAVSGRERPALFTLVISAAVVGAWAWGFWHAEFFVGLPAEKRGSPTGLIAYTFITCAHLIMARQPLRSPFETIERVLRRDA